MSAAVEVARHAGAGRIVAAVPVGAPAELRELAGSVDEVVCIHAPAQFYAVGTHYIDFGQVDDETVDKLLAESRARHPS
jgi:putative phosphoribosyl transferase